MKITTLIVAAAFLLLGHSAIACQFNTDCAIGSQCVKQGSSLYGICVGGSNPGNSNDRSPVYDSLDLNRGSAKGYSNGDARRRQDSDGTHGDTCSFNVDCGFGKQCLKSPGSLYGVCM